MNAIADHGVDVVNERVHSVMAKEFSPVSLKTA